jgi:hypothetical protein
MTELPPTDTSINVPLGPTPPAKPSQTDVSAFSKLFQLARHALDRQSSDDPSLSKGSSSSMASSTRTLPESPTDTVMVTDPALLRQLFPDMGIDTVADIHAVIIQVTRHVATNTPLPVQPVTCFIHLHPQAAPIPLAVHSVKGALHITSTPQMAQLLTQYLPELKAHLKRKHILVDDIVIASEDL